VIRKTIQWLANMEDKGLGNGNGEGQVPKENIVRTVDMHHDAGKKMVVVYSL